MLLTLHAFCGILFVIGMLMTIVMKVRREINDLFLRKALYFLIFASAISAIMCFIVCSYNADQYLDDQKKNIARQ